MNMEGAIISNCRCHTQTQTTGDEGDTTPRFVTDLSKIYSYNFRKWTL